MTHSARTALRQSILGAGAVLILMLLAPAVAQARYAYVANSGTNDVSVIDTATNAVVGPKIALGGSPTAIAAIPDGSRVYVVNGFSDVSVIDTRTNTTIGGPIKMGSANALAFSPDGRRVYVANPVQGTITVIDTTTNGVVGSPIRVCDEAGPVAIAVTPQGSRAYVPCGDNAISVVDTTTNREVTVIQQDVGEVPQDIAVTPDGLSAYVANRESNDVSVIDTTANAVVGNPIKVGTRPRAIAITPDGSRAYVVNQGQTPDRFNPNARGTVSVIDTATKRTVGNQIPVGPQARAVAITPDGARAYVANFGSSNVSVIDTEANSIVGSPIRSYANPTGVAIADRPAGRTADFGLEVKVKRPQTSLRRLLLRTTCTGTDCEARARGALRVRRPSGSIRRLALGTRSRSLERGVSERLVLRIGKRARAAARRALDGGRRVSVRARVRASDEDGRQRVRVRRVRVIR